MSLMMVFSFIKYSDILYYYPGLRPPLLCCVPQKLDKKKRKMRYTTKEKLSIIKKYKDGIGSTTLSKETGIEGRQILEWVRKYERHGKKGLEISHLKRHSEETKKQAVYDLLENRLSLRIVCEKYDLSRRTLRTWKKKALDLMGEQRLEALQVVQNESFMGRKRLKEPETELEKLKLELEYLRAENALLKKAKALVEEKEALRAKSGRGSSKN